MAAQDRHPPFGDVTSPSMVAEAIERLAAAMDQAAHVESISASARVTDVRTLLAAYAEMKEGLAVSQESGSRPRLDESELERVARKHWEARRKGFSIPRLGMHEVMDWSELPAEFRAGEIEATKAALSSQIAAPDHSSRAELESLRSKLDIAVKALEPFALAAEYLHPALPDDGRTLDEIEVRHWRAAWSAVQELTK